MSKIAGLSAESEEQSRVSLSPPTISNSFAKKAGPKLRREPEEFMTCTKEITKVQRARWPGSGSAFIGMRCSSTPGVQRNGSMPLITERKETAEELGHMVVEDGAFEYMEANQFSFFPVYSRRVHANPVDQM